MFVLINKLYNKSNEQCMFKIEESSIEMDNFKLEVFSLDEEFGQWPCKNVLRVFQLIISYNCFMETLFFLSYWPI